MKRNTRSFFVAGLIGMAMIGAASALGSAETQPQQQCGDRDMMVRQLAEQYEEAPTAVGQINGDAVMEVFASEEGSWTIIASGTDGISCVVFAGEGWEGGPRFELTSRSRA